MESPAHVPVTCFLLLLQNLLQLLVLQSNVVRLLDAWHVRNIEHEPHLVEHRVLAALAELDEVQLLVDAADDDELGEGAPELRPLVVGEWVKDSDALAREEADGGVRAVRVWIRLILKEDLQRELRV